MNTTSNTNTNADQNEHKHLLSYMLQCVIDEHIDVCRLAYILLMLCTSLWAGSYIIYVGLSRCLPYNIHK